MWFGRRVDAEVDAVALLYVGQPLPTLLTLAEPREPIVELLADLLQLLPGRFHAHLTPGVEKALATAYRMTSYGEHFKMALSNPAAVARCDCAGVSRLGLEDLEAVERLNFCVPVERSTRCPKATGIGPADGVGICDGG
jgi:hypothetical protein